MPREYSNQERAALFELMLANRVMLNRELAKELKIKLGPTERDRLNEEGLLRSWKESVIHHQITDEGIDWCMNKMVEGNVPAPSGPLARAETKMLRIFALYHQRRGTLLEVIRSGDLETLIRAAYLDLSVKPQDWVRLAKLRPRLNGADKVEVDEVLLRMVRTGAVHLAPDSNRKVLTDADHAAAVRIGDEDNHLVAIEES